MRLLLDTHVALWWITSDKKLSDDARRAIEDDENDVYLSVVSIWEIGIKNARPKGLGNDLSMSGEEVLEEFKRAGLELLSIGPRHAAVAGALPRHHGDPFDRMLAAQARYENMTLMTRDAVMRDYGIALWWA